MNKGSNTKTLKDIKLDEAKDLLLKNKHLTDQVFFQKINKPVIIKNQTSFCSCNCDLVDPIKKCNCSCHILEK